MKFRKLMKACFSGKFDGVAYPYESYLIRNKCIFIHVPKAAGTSVLAALGKTQPTKGRRHLPWYVYYQANPVLFERFFKFCFVRNPFDRVLSAYNYFVRGGGNSWDVEIGQKLLEYGSFDNFVVNGLGRGRMRHHPLFMPQANFIIGRNEKIMVDFVGRFEALGSDYKYAARKIGMESNLLKINSARADDKDDYRSHYTSNESISVVEYLYAQDLHFFGYEFE